MLNVNEFLSKTPFDLYELSLFHLVARHHSFTKAAQAAGLTQSAITRQIQGIENSLGIDLLKRTTRSVHLTKAGEFLFQESGRLLGNVDDSLRRLKEDFANVRKEIRIGVSRSISLAHLPGFFHANLQHNSNIRYHASSLTSEQIVTALETNEIDIGVLCPPPRLPKTLDITHRFTDVFTIIATTSLAADFNALPQSNMARNTWLQKQPWLLIDENTNTGKQLRKWMLRSGLKMDPAMQLDSFDLIITLVSLGMGVGFVPRRALAFYGQKKSISRLILPNRFERELVVIMRRHRKQPFHLVQFVQNILF